MVPSPDQLTLGPLPETFVCAHCHGGRLVEVAALTLALDAVMRSYGDPAEGYVPAHSDPGPIPGDLPSAGLFCSACDRFFGWVA